MKKPAAKKKNKAPPRHKGPGCPTKLTATLADKAVTLSTSLATDAALCRALRVAQGTWCDWKNKAAGGRQPYKDLFERIEEAQAIEEIDLMSKIKSDPAWRARAWALERRARGYENRAKLEHTGKDGDPLPANTAPPPFTLVIQGGWTGDNPYNAPPAKG